MKCVVWTCDRCGATTTAAREVVICEDFKPSAIENGVVDKAPGWREFAGDERITDVCPNCITAGEQVDAMLAGVEADFIFGDRGS
jgi:hypothetical protein